MVASRQVEVGSREEGGHHLVLAEEERLGLGVAALAGAEVGERDVGVPAREPHGRLEVGTGSQEEGLGLAPPAQLHEERGLHAVAVARQEHGAARLEADVALQAEQVCPRPGPLEVGGEVAGGEERAHRLGRGGLVVSRTAHQGHGLVEEGHARIDVARLHLREPRVGQCLRLEVQVAELPGPIEGELRPLEQHGGIVDVAAHGGDGHPALLQAGWEVGDQPLGPGEPRPARGLVAQDVGHGVAEAHARHRRLAGQPRGREAAHGRRQVGDQPLDVSFGERPIRPNERALRPLRLRHPQSIALRRWPGVVRCVGRSREILGATLPP
jgi:hypothetical protein